MFRFRIFKPLFLIVCIFVSGNLAKPQNANSRNRVNVINAPDSDDILQNTTPEYSTEETEAIEYLRGRYETDASDLCNKQAIAEWNYSTDLNNAAAAAAATAASIAYSQFQFKEWNETIKNYGFSTFQNEETKRQLTFLNKTGTAALNAVDLQEYNVVLSQMSQIYGTSRVCPFTKQNCNITTEGLRLQPDLEGILSTSQNYTELAYVWSAWREVTGRNSEMRSLYRKYVDLSNKAAQMNDEKDMGDFWLLRYESADFKAQMQTLWDEVKPLYVKLYSYVRYRLSEVYPELDRTKTTADPMPAHILGNMWAQSWDNVYDHVLPFKAAPKFDVTERMKERYQPGQIVQIFELANKFFVDLTLSDMSMSYGEKAQIVRPTTGKEVECHASAWDFCDKEDYRIKMCTEINMEDLITVHHELGHIQYDLNYKNLPITFREGANPGFHEAIGDVIALSVATPKHMIKIDLMEPNEASPESTINYLMKMALEKVAFLPFGYLIDAYRWKIFNGSITADKYTYEWLKMRAEIQGIVPPNVRDEIDFDPGAKYHVPGNTPYIRYFVSFILQFQLHKKLCEVAGQTTGLHDCDIDGNAAAGNLMKQLLSAGASKNWKTLLREITGSENLDAAPLKEYFRLLEEYLDAQAKEHDYPATWRADAFEDLYDDGEKSDTVLIIVGIALAAAVLIIVIGYFVKSKVMK